MTQKYHPKLQIAIDRLKKRYSNLQIENHKGGNPSHYKTKDGTMSTESVITMVDVYTDTSRVEFVHMYVAGFRHDDFDEHEFYLKSRLVDNQRYPRDEKKTIRDKLIPKIVDEFAKPFTLVEECFRLLKKGKAIVENQTYQENWKKNNLARDIADKYGSIVVNMLLGNPVEEIPQDAKVKAKEYMETLTKLDELGSNDKAVQVIAFELHDRWVVNIYNAPTGDKCITYNDFESMPNAIKEKVALLKLASEDEILENIGVKVETQSYFLYGAELATIS
jgi:hypothetical protein